MKLFDILFPSKQLMHPLDDMSGSIEYYNRMNRGVIHVTDSEVSRAVPMKLVAEEGRYEGTGYYIKQVDE